LQAISSREAIKYISFLENTMRDRRLPPFWVAPPLKRFDLQILRPETLPKGHRFETIKDCAGYCDRNLSTLSKCGGVAALIYDIERCSDEMPCRQILCPHCACLYRRWFSGEALTFAQLAESGGFPMRVLTVLLEQVPNEYLPKVSIDVLHERLRQRLRRAGFTHAIGGTEADYDPENDTWTVHVHLLAFEWSEARHSELVRMAKADEIERAIRKQPLRDPVSQISYMQKFSTVYRYGNRYRGKPPAFPFKAAQMEAFAKWTLRYRFEDFLFAFGFRRRGSRLIRITSGNTQFLAD
jgi:hypothetical protein